MKALLLSTVYGLYAFDEANKPIQKIYADKSPMELSEIYLKLQKGDLREDLKDFLTTLKKNQYTQIFIEDPDQINPLSQVGGIRFSTPEDPIAIKAVRTSLVGLFLSTKVASSIEEMQARTKVLSEFIIKAQVHEFSTQHDLHVKQCVDTIGDINKSINFLATRLREWYGLHFPELTDKLLDDNLLFTQFVAGVGARNSYNKENLMSLLKMSADKAELVISKSLRSMGGDLTPTDLATLQLLAKQTLELVAFKDKMEAYLAEILQEVAPNLKHVLGVPVASQLIALAGSLEKLAEYPSSTIQLLGAEKALFKALKFGVKTPKHGIIFQWHKIRSEKTYLRGKISRMVAGKVSICAKVDFYKGQFIGDKMSEEIDKKIDQIKKAFPKAPEKAPQSGSGFRGGREGGREGGRDGGHREGGRREGRRQDGSARGKTPEVRLREDVPQAGTHDGAPRESNRREARDSGDKFSRRDKTAGKKGGGNRPHFREKRNRGPQQGGDRR